MAKKVLGIDIGGTNTKFGIVDREGHVLFNYSVKTKIHEKIDDLFITIKRTIEEKSSFEGVEAIGIGAPNGNYLKTNYPTIISLYSINTVNLILTKESRIE